MPVMFELSQCSASASALIGIGSPGFSVPIAIACWGEMPSSDRIAQRRRLSSMKICQKRRHASRAASGRLGGRAAIVAQISRLRHQKVDNLKYLRYQLTT